ncbi:hypothetical protein AMS68_003749 [Peltaster fructicola]|uniref:Separin n=1 Tax=Peltaster fructicola TaxID=286661 RepID=A0A6H0XTY1_9PEZI|nr:hypothetical protein AMS68_003749 [Peltaster fructicola]
MPQREDEIFARVKADIAAQQANHDTVDLVHGLLRGLSISTTTTLYGSCKNNEGSRKPSIARAGRKAAPTATARLNGGRSPSKDVSCTQKRRLATELATLGSKVLAGSAPLTQKFALDEGKDNVSRQALQPRSGNTTPSPKKSVCGAKSKTAAAQSTNDGAIVATAQCTHVALSYLRSAVTAETRRRLLEGSLAFCKHLLAYGMKDLILVELGACRSLLDKHGVPVDGMTHKTSTIARLLCAEGEDNSDPELARLAVVHQTLVFKAITLQCSPRMVNDLASHLVTTTRPPHEVIASYTRLTKQNDKAAIYLETMATALLSLCPKLSVSADAEVLNDSSCAGPLAMFRIQIYALHLRKTWWILANHQIDIRKTLSVQYTKVLRAYIRRSAVQAEAGQVYTAALAGYKLIFDDTSDPIAADYEVLSVLGALAVTGGFVEDIMLWNKRLHECCSNFLDTDCRKLVAMTFQLCQHIEVDAIDILATHLAGKLQGHPEHYEMLLSGLAGLLQHLHANTRVIASAPYSRLVRSALRILCWAANAYPELESSSQRSIICSALRSCSRSDMTSWLDSRAMLCFIREGSMVSVEQAARVKGLKDAFMCSAEVIALGELIEVLTLRQLNGSSTRLDETDHTGAERLRPLERGLLLEWRLRACLKHGGSSKIQTKAGAICRNILSELDKLYDAAKFPIRRALVGIQAAIAASKGFASRKEIAVWQDIVINEDELAQDAGLGRYVPEITACLQISSFLEQTKRSPAQIIPALQAWHSILHNPANADVIDQVVYDKATLAGLLDTLASFCAALGWQEECLWAYQIRTILLKLAKSSVAQMTDALLDVSESSSAAGFPPRYAIC